MDFVEREVFTSLVSLRFSIVHVHSIILQTDINIVNESIKV